MPGTNGDPVDNLWIFLIRLHVVYMTEGHQDIENTYVCREYCTSMKEGSKCVFPAKHEQNCKIMT